MKIMCNLKLDFYFLYMNYNTECNYKSSWGSIVGIVTRESAGETRVRSLVSTRYFFLLQNFHIGSRALYASYSMDTGVLLGRRMARR